MSERSRGPEGASSPASTQSEPSGGDDIYAAAAASAAGRNAKRSAPSRPARSAGSAPEAQTDGSSTAARAQPVDDEPRKAPSNGAANPTAKNGNAPSTSTAAQPAGKPAAETAGDPADGGEPTSKLSGLASSVLNRVRSTGKADGDKADSPKPAVAKADAPTADASKADGLTDGVKAGGTARAAAAGAAAGAAVTSRSTNTATPVANGSADQANEPTAAIKRETIGPLPTAGTPTAGADTVEAGKADRPKAGAARGTRKARLRLSRLDPWSVMKTAFLFSIAAGIVMVVAVYAVWLVIGSSGLFDSVDSIVGSVLQSPGDTTPFRIEDYVNTQKVMGVTAFLACIDVVIFTALATLASFLYNLAATMLGGLEVTLAED